MKTTESKNPFTMRRHSAQPHFSTQGDHHSEAEASFFSPVQAKLEIGQPNDKYEQEANTMADKVVQSDASQAIGSDASPNLQMRCAACESEQGIQRTTSAKEPQGDIQTQPLLMRKAQNGASVGTPALASQLNRSKGGGQAMPDNTNQQMSQSFGTDFSGVRIHTGSRASEMNQGLSARAFTHGSDIYFNQGEYNPGATEGKILLAHELTHVVQQGGGIEKKVQRLVRPQNVVHGRSQELALGLTRQQAIDAIVDAEAEAVRLAQIAEDSLRDNLASVQAGNPVDVNFNTILQEELGLNLANPRHFGLIRQQADRFRRVRTTLESGYIRYLTLGVGQVSLIGCSAGDCTDAFAFTCPGNRLMVLCNPFWDETNERASTILHEPFHIWFSMDFHQTTALRRADASCFESFALRVDGQNAPASCVGHTNG